MRVGVVIAIGLAIAGKAEAGFREVLYGKMPDWAEAAPTASADPTPAGATVRVIYTDTQVHLGLDADDSLTAYRMRILSPEALALGKVTAVWNPSTDNITVHKLSIIRDGKVMDVISANKFQVLQREDNLDKSMLDGQLTAVLQVPNLEVGDELEFAASIHHRDSNLGGASHGALQLATVGLPGTYRARLLWPEGKQVQWRAIDLAAGTPKKVGDWREISITLDNPKSAITPDGAPPRYAVHRLLQYSSFAKWADVSHAFAPLFERAAKLNPDSPVIAEAKKIGAQTNDPKLRTQAALKLVQDRIRYVYVGLNGGNYNPATADETWSRRFGDCKAKTVLLLALLYELGVDAEPVLVNSKQDDGADLLLPTPDVFDHVLVRAKIGSQQYWLDGTRFDQYYLDSLPPEPSSFVLPLRNGSVELEKVRPQPASRPQLVQFIEVDARAGLRNVSNYKIIDVFRGDGAVTMRTQLASLAPDDADRLQKTFWRQQMSSVEPDNVSWRYDDQQNMLVLTMAGKGKADWDGDDKDGHGLTIYGAGFTPPNEMHRPKEQDQTASWVTDFPTYKCWVTTIRLPAARPGWAWDYSAEPVNVRLGGVRYWRVASLKDGVVRTVMSRQTFSPEITAAQAQEVNNRLPKFDNNMSRVFERDASQSPTEDHSTKQPLPPGDDVDWSSPTAPCASSS